MRIAVSLVLTLGLGTWAYAQHEHAHQAKPSDHTLRQVMQHLGAATQQIQLGLLMNNRLMIQEGAKAIAHHPAPKGGIAPYIKKNHEKLKPIIKEMDARVHDTALQMAEQSATGSMIELEALSDKMVLGCISCHNVFRD